MGPGHSCAYPMSTEETERYSCRECHRWFDDLGSLAAHVEQSESCPADVRSEYFKDIIATVNSADRRAAEIARRYDEYWSD